MSPLRRKLIILWICEIVSLVGFINGHGKFAAFLIVCGMGFYRISKPSLPSHPWWTHLLGLPVVLVGVALLLRVPIAHGSRQFVLGVAFAFLVAYFLTRWFFEVRWFRLNVGTIRYFRFQPDDPDAPEIIIKPGEPQYDILVDALENSIRKDHQGDLFD